MDLGEKSRSSPSKSIRLLSPLEPLSFVTQHFRNHPWGSISIGNVSEELMATYDEHLTGLG